MTETLGAGHAGYAGPNSPGHSGATLGTPSVNGSNSTAETSHGSLSTSDSPSSSAQTSPYHTHRQNHNSSKLPAFRFADLQNTKQQSLSLPSPQYRHHPIHQQSAVPSPTTPGSPNQSRTIAQNGNNPNSSPQQYPLNSGDPNGSGPVAPARRPHRSVSSSSSASSGSGSDLESGHQQNSPRNHAIGADSPRLTTHQALQPPPPHHHQPEQQSQHRDVDSDQPSRTSPRARASTVQEARSPTTSAPAPAAKTTATRPASFPDSPPPVDAPTATAAPSARPQHRRAPASSRGSNASESGAQYLTSRRQTSLESNGDSTTKEWAQGQRELILPKSLATQASSPTDEKRQPTRSRPPLSFRKPSNTPAPSVRVAPIRSFRSSGSRRSFGLDMNSSPIHAGDSSGDDYGDPHHRDRTLRALEGRSDDETMQATTTTMSWRERDAAAAAAQDADDTTGDVFMKIARQEAPAPRNGAEFNTGAAAADHTNAMVSLELTDAQSRVTRSSHRRPLSTNIPSSSYRATSPQRPRRLSDQESTRSRTRQLDDDASTDIVSHVPYRGLNQKAASAHPGEDLRPLRLGNRASPITPRSQAFNDGGAEISSYARRRTSITDSNGAYSARTPAAYRHSTLNYSQPRTFNSSPLAPRTAEPPRQDYHHPEGTESTASTTAPSTVWDELDEIKSRIHRLELTGKLPSTSSAAMHKALDERPPTATNTTVSTSPKQAPGGAMLLNDASSTTSSQKETQQPLLVSALGRSKGVLSEEVNQALESAVTDAVALLAMMGTAGQPGPISSGASTIGAGGTLTDRQLRRRAEGICRSLTELVIALNGEAATSQVKTVTVTSPAPRNDGTPTTPTLTKAFPTLQGSGHQRRGSVTTNEPAERPNSIPSPRAMSKLEERRNTMLNSSALPTPRFAQAPNTPLLSTPAAASALGRKSSLLISRTRRAATEEPEDGRRSSMMLRTRRAGTEELDDGRTTSLLRDRKMHDLDSDDMQFRPPSRAATDVNAFRAVSHQHPPPSYQSPDASAGGAGSSLPRRRVGSSMLGSRLASPSSFGSALSGRRFLDRSTADREGNSVADKLAEERGQRQASQGPSSLLSRTTSLLRRPNRESTSTNSSTSAQAGGYR
ncbi:hypothetical protein F5X68DRAFT_169175 [Plectosphaerella plurivora]|uniref:LPXTG-motif cell wall anchor domain protein n=1 Tax=Plectosphaerella plurivora TaxID=936078 RepID=A0A9P9AAX7_9PEZI|nr:hypothetical protein F5X68DRAFT_169175 [Plectosphaerella plurivora]